MMCFLIDWNTQNLTPEMERVTPLNRVPVILYWNEYFFDEYAVSTKNVYNDKYHRPKDVNPNYFNYTGSYRSRSYVYYPYDDFVPLTGKEKPGEVWTDKQVEEKLAGKKKAVLIAMSNCGAESARLDFKIFNFRRMKNLIVPVVLSRAVMPKHIPKNTYIAASDFDSPEHLATFMKKLMENKDQYKKYFEWTKLYRKTRISEEEVKVSCQLCKLAHKQPKHQINNYKKHWSNHECAENFAVNLIDNSPDNINSARWAEKRLDQLMSNSYRHRDLNKL
ncbi:Alpha1,3-fucosyltransferase-like proteinue [Aphelenchoides bicaudatus]|nr:Alpha1,3-fucosyltransferase-like proteinue [Aphelenchoides bicaudatus]